MSDKADNLVEMLKGRLTIEVETEAPAFTGSVYLVATLKLDGKKLSQSKTALPDIASLKRAEYNDF